MQNSFKVDDNKIDLLTNYLEKMSLNNSTNTNSPSISAAKAIADFLPIFDGDNEQLESFIYRSDKFYNSYGNTTDNGLSDFVFNVICSKLRGNVGNFLMCRPDLTTWPHIKIALRQHFGDKIDRQTLMREFLQLTKNRNETILDFLERLKQLKSRVEVKIQTDELLTADQKILLINQNELNSLDVLTINSDDKLRILLDIKQPVNLSDAYNLVIRHFNNETRINALARRYEPSRQIQKIQNVPNNRQNFKPQFISNFGPSHRFNPQPIHTQFMYAQQQPPLYQPQNRFIPTTSQQFPSQPINIQPRENFIRKYPTNQQVFGKQQTGNAFSPKNSHKPSGPVTPMSTNSRNPTIQSKPNHFRPTGPPKFAFEELYNTEQEENFSSYQNNDIEYPLENSEEINYEITNNPDANYIENNHENFHEDFYENPES